MKIEEIFVQKIYIFFLIDEAKFIIMKELTQVFSKVAEEKIPDKLIDTINLIELDSKTKKILEDEYNLKKENVNIFKQYFVK